MADTPGKPSLPEFGEEYDGARMRSFVRQLENLFARIRVNGPLIIGGGRTITKYFGATATWDPPSVAAGAQTTTTVAMAGVLLAAFNTVQVGFNKDLQGMQLTGYVSADAVVTVVLRNGTAGAIDLASGSLTVGVLRHG